MNQIKIGAFISERRKAKGWTQSQLAEKLEITDKAISKWETGRSMPDLSLFMPLCTLLDVTLNELFAGECIAEEKLKPESVNHLGEIFSENLKILCLWRYVFLQCFHPIVKKYLESYNPKTLAVIRFLAHFHLLGSRIQVERKSR